MNNLKDISFADVVHPSLRFRSNIPSERLVLDLLDTRWVQRLRDVSQTANTRLVYMFSEHSRFGHSLGVAFLANLLMDRLVETHASDIAPYREAISAAALLHDLGHLAPGSHTAFKTWFPDTPDEHESIAIKIIKEDPELQEILGHYSPQLADNVCKILSEDSSLPPWTWQIISGGGWNVDRGNWCMLDSILAGVSYGKYNVAALIESIQLSKDKKLTLRENRLDAMMHFALSRHAMYRQIFQHRVLLAADALNRSIAKRARELTAKSIFADDSMQEVLHARSYRDLSLETIYKMRESWWRYHLMRWSEDNDPILADLSNRLLNRKLFKTVRIRSGDNKIQLHAQAEKALSDLGLDPSYYLHEISTVYVHESDFRQSILVSYDDGTIRSLGDAEPLYDEITQESELRVKSWLALPAEAKIVLGRAR